MAGNGNNNGFCTPLSCPKYQVCDYLSGGCVSDYCSTPADCPAGYACKETYCTGKCDSDADCRTDYACKAFEDDSYCGITGNTGYGGACFSHTSCIAAAVCAFQNNSGYCASMGCLENGVVCPATTQCTYVGANQTSICGLMCDDNNDCRTDDGYTCQMWDFDPSGTCLPD